MSGTAKVTTDKDGIFGRFLCVYDGSVFRRLLGSTSGLLLSGLRPSNGYFPIQIDDPFTNLYISPLLPIGFTNTNYYTVPANKILVLKTVCVNLIAGASNLIILVGIDGLNQIVYHSDVAPVLGAFNVLLRDLTFDAGSVLNLQIYCTAVNSQIRIFNNGYLINKT